MFAELNKTQQMKGSEVWLVSEALSHSNLVTQAMATQAVADRRGGGCFALLNGLLPADQQAAL